MAGGMTTNRWLKRRVDGHVASLPAIEAPDAMNCFIRACCAVTATCMQASVRF